MLPRIAIIGRPNVGKSSLFNRLAGRRISIVDPTPGVTRDRVSFTIEIPPPSEPDGGESGVREPRYAELIDTGGYGIYTAEGKRFDDAGEDLSRLTGQIEAQIRAAVDEATLILFVTDAQSGLTPLDHTIATMLRRQGHAPKVMAVANKVDDEGWEAHAQEMATLGFGVPVPVSATSGYRRRQFIETVWARVPPDTGSARDAEMKLAIVGRRNAGKSSVINALAGQPRVIVSEIAGTTRDAVDVRFEIEGRAMVAIDTAGVRKRKSWADDIEQFAHERMLQAISRADVCVLLIDAREKATQLEKRLGQELVDRQKPTVIAINKWDLVERELKPADYLEYLEQEFPGLSYAPIVFLSAKTGDGVPDLVRMSFNLYRQASHRETTGRLNGVIHDILAERGPSSKLGTKAKVYYISQIDIRPPTIVMVVNKPALFEGAYERYLLNRLREHLPYSEVPIRLLFSERKRLTLNELLSRRRSTRGRSSDERGSDRVGDRATDREE